MLKSLQLNTIILAGGFGTRCAHDGKYCPKGLIEVTGTTLLGKLLQAIQAARFATVPYLVTNQLFYAQFKQYLVDHFSNLAISLLNDGATDPANRLGALGDLLLAADTIDPALPTLVCASDTVFEFPLADLVALYHQHQAFTTAVYPAGHERIAGRLGCVNLDGNRVVGFTEKPAQPTSEYAAVPFYIFPPGLKELLLAYQASGHSMDAPGNLIPWLLEQGRPVYALIAENVIDVGTIQDIERLREQSTAVPVSV